MHQPVNRRSIVAHVNVANVECGTRLDVATKKANFLIEGHVTIDEEQGAVWRLY